MPVTVESIQQARDVLELIIVDDQLPNGLAALIADYLALDSTRVGVLADMAKEHGIRRLGYDQFVTARAPQLAPFIAAYELCIIDIGEIVSLPVPALVELMAQAVTSYDLEFQRGYHLIVKANDNHTLVFPESLTLTHPKTGQRFYSVTLGGLVLEAGLDYLKGELGWRNLGAYPIPNELSKDDGLAFVADRAMVTNHPEKYVPGELASACCCVIDISQIAHLTPPEVADRIYLAWVSLGLRHQLSCYVILKEEGEPDFSYSSELDQIPQRAK